MSCMSFLANPVKAELKQFYHRQTQTDQVQLNMDVTFS